MTYQMLISFFLPWTGYVHQRLMSNQTLGTLQNCKIPKIKMVGGASIGRALNVINTAALEGSTLECAIYL